MARSRGNAALFPQPRRFVQILTRLALAGVLSGCVAAAPGADGSGLSSASAKPAPGKVTVAGGAVSIAGPAGYCIDSSASRDGADGAFVLLGSCASLSGSASRKQPQNPAVLTATVVAGPGDDTAFAASFPAMAKFLSSSVGRAALSRSGKAESVQIAQIASVRDVLYIRASDTAEARGQGVEAEYWRALMMVKGRIVTLSALGLRDLPLEPGVKRSLLEAFVARVRVVNGG